MMLYPALDLLDGQCVRLRLGDFEQKTIYSSDPIDIVARMEKSGARFLHLVDLSGAKNPSNRQFELIKKIVESTKLRVQCGGGIRSRDEVKALLDVGVGRIVLGSLSVTHQDVVSNMIHEFGAHSFTLAMDVRPQNNEEEYQLSVSGWQEKADLRLDQWLEFYLKCGIKRYLCTDISRDGNLTGPNVGLYQKLQRQYPTIELIASGGVSSLEDLKQLKDSHLFAVVVGKALYEGKFTLQEALDLC